MTNIDSTAIENNLLRKNRKLLADVIKIKDEISDLADKRALDHLAKQMADELSIPYQTDAIDG